MIFHLTGKQSYGLSKQPDSNDTRSRTLFTVVVNKKKISFGRSFESIQPLQNMHSSSLVSSTIMAFGSKGQGLSLGT